MSTSSIDWDRQIKNLQEIFRELDRKDRNARDRARKLAHSKNTEKKPPGPPSRCAKCKRFSREKLCSKCSAVS